LGQIQEIAPLVSFFELSESCVDFYFRRLPEKNVPYHAGFKHIFKALKQAHSSLCNCLSNAEDGLEDKREGTFFDKNRLKIDS
jgi:hypothetical protein